MSALNASGHGAAQAASSQAQPPQPWIPETGNPSLDVLVGDLNDAAAPFQGLSDPNESDLHKANAVISGTLGAIETPVKLLNDGFALLTQDIAKLFPALPAATLGTMHLGIPHTHQHPPSLIPPGPPIPLPSLGPVLLAGCASVLINGIPAARAGDLGLAITCGTFSPPFEVSTGSSNVFIGGARAARIGDITKHCQPPDVVGTATGPLAKIIAGAGTALAVAGKALGYAGVGAGVLGAVTTADDARRAEDRLAADKADAAAKHAAAQEAADAAAASPTAANRAAAEKARKAAEEAAGQVDKDERRIADGPVQARMLAIQAGLDAAALALGMLMGKDPGTPPCFGALLTGTPNVLIGGFPMPPWTTLLRGLGKLGGKRLKPRPNKRKGQVDDGKRSGEPINPITGATEEEIVDYEASEPHAFRWDRNYTSADAGRDGQLGRGFRHSFEHRLSVGLDQVIYTDARGRAGEIPLPGADEDESFGGGCVLAVWEDGETITYEIARAGEPTSVFTRERRGGAEPRLVRMHTPDVRIDLHYDDRGHLTGLTEVSDQAAIKTRFRLDNSGRIVEVGRGPRSAREIPLIAAYAYDPAGCLVAFQDALGASASYAYDAAHRLVRLTDRNGYSFHFAYDDQGRCIEEHGDDGLWRVALRYAPEQRRTFVTEADGGEWIYEYDENRTLIAIHDPYGGKRQFVLDDEGKVVREFGADGRTRRRFLYDEAGKNYGLVDSFGYFHPPLDEEPNPPNPLVHRVADTAMEQQFGGELDAEVRDETWLHELPEAIQAFASTLRSSAHAAGKPIVRHDALGRKVEEIDAAGRRQAWAYDASGNVLRHIDRDGRKHATEVVSWNLVGAEIDPLGRRTQYHYTAREQVARIVDPGGNESDYQYDLKDRLVRVLRHGVVREEYAYDLADRLVEKRDGAGQVLLRLSIGDNGLPSERRLSSGEVHRYAYDERGNILRAAADAVEVRRGFTAWGALSFDERDGRGVRHRFEALDLRETTYLGRFTVGYDRDPDGALRIGTPVGGEHLLRHDERGTIVATLGNGTRVLASYDEEGRCLGRAAWWPRGGRISHWSARYLYSAEGELHRAEDSVRGPTDYSYDATRRVIGESGPNGRKAVIVLDAAGNIRAKPCLDDVTLLESNRLAAAGGERFRYNARNHLVEQVDASGATTRYRYNSLDMLVGVSWNGRAEEWRAAYDGLGRRLYKALGDQRTEYFWDGDRLAAEVGPTGTLRIYVYAGPEALVPLLFIDYHSDDADPASGRIYYPVGNQLGVPLHIEDRDGRVVWWAEDVEPYGTVTVRPGASITYALRFPGHYHDPETGLHYNRFRYYSPRLGRYLQSDPAGQSGGINLYAYPANPLIDVDVLGLHPGKEGSSQKRSSDEAGITIEEPRKLRNTPARQQRDEIPPPDKTDLELIKNRNDKAILTKNFEEIAAHRKKYEDALANPNFNDESRPGQTAKITEAKGERAATLHMISQGDHELISGFKPGTGFDQVWVKKDTNNQISQYTIVEAKGPGAKLGNPPGKGPQMSKGWVEITLDAMQNTNRSKEDRQLATDIQNAIDGKPPGVLVRGRVIEAVDDSGASQAVDPRYIDNYGEGAFDYNRIVHQ